MSVCLYVCLCHFHFLFRSSPVTGHSPQEGRRSRLDDLVLDVFPRPHDDDDLPLRQGKLDLFGDISIASPVQGDVSGSRRDRVTTLLGRGKWPHTVVVAATHAGRAVSETRRREVGGAAPHHITSCPAQSVSCSPFHTRLSVSARPPNARTNLAIPTEILPDELNTSILQLNDDGCQFTSTLIDSCDTLSSQRTGAIAKPVGPVLRYHAMPPGFSRSA